MVVAGATAVVSLVFVVAAARWGWLGPDVGRGSGFCEAEHAGWVLQPTSTWSNLGFVVSGLAVAWYAADRLRLGLTMGAHPGLATAYAVLVVLLGPGSMAMHATQSALGGHLDLFSMYLVSGFALGYAAMRVWRRGRASSPSSSPCSSSSAWRCTSRVDQCPWSTTRATQPSR